ncbi:MAG: hypothetical protein IPH31_18045 [Lewinellaceae bacterium]|nr:hypothetical protein [Lewinellaceae bacterium]
MLKKTPLPSSKWAGRLLLLPFISIALSFSAFVKSRFTISGTVTDRASGEHLIRATVRDVKSGKAL